MSFVHRQFIAGASSGEENDSDDDSLGSTEDYIAQAVANDGPDVESIVSSCVRGIARVVSLEEKERLIATKKRASPVPQTNDGATFSDVARSQPVPSRESPSLTSPVTTVNTIEETEFEKALKARAIRFGLYGATLTAKGQEISQSKAPEAHAVFVPSSKSSFVSDTNGSAANVSPPQTEPSSTPPVGESDSKLVVEGTVGIQPSEGAAPDSVSSTKTTAQVVIHTDSLVKKDESSESAESESAPKIETKRARIESEEEEIPTDERTKPRKVYFHLDPSVAPALYSDQLNQLCNVLGRGDYNHKVTASMMKKLADVMPNIGSTLDDRALSKIRHELLVQRAAKAHASLKQGGKVAARYSNGEGILPIAVSLSAPALACFRCVLEARNLSKNAIKSVINGKHKLQDPRDAAELAVAIGHDTTTTELPDQAKGAALFEAEIQRMLDKAGVRYKTQADMLKSKSTLTPDFLIDVDELYIENQRVTWIDAKDFFGRDSGFWLSKMKSQGNKYTKQFGPGAFLFSCGVAEELIKAFQDRGIMVYDFRWLRAGPPKPSEATADRVTKHAAGSSAEDEEPAKKMQHLSPEGVWCEALRLIETSVNVTETSISEETTEKVNALLAELDIEPYTMDELNAIRHDLLQDHAERLLNDEDPSAAGAREAVNTELLKGESILKIAAELRVPPLVVLAFAVEKNNRRLYATLQTARTSKDLAPLGKLMKKRFQSALMEMMALNVTYLPREEKPFETNVLAFLQSVNVKVSGKDAPLRHLEISSDLTIEGCLVRWIITSNHLGGASKEHMATIKEMSSILVTSRGPGAIVFALGFIDVPDFKLPERVVFVDYRLLGLASASSE